MRQTLPAFMPQLFKHEGGYVDHPRDPGGATNLGITIETLRRWRGKAVTKADVRALTKDEAERIYKAFYWDKIGGDSLLAGPDAALFDVAVNSGVGRARQWLHLINGKSPVDGVKAVCARRRAFFRSLRTFDVFGRGWMRRVNEVEAWCIAWALKVHGQGFRPTLQKEAAQSKAKATASGAGATGAGGAVVAVPQTDMATGIDWIVLLSVATPVAILFAFLLYQAMSQSARAKAFEEAAEGLEL